MRMQNFFLETDTTFNTQISSSLLLSRAYTFTAPQIPDWLAFITVQTVQTKRKEEEFPEKEALTERETDLKCNPEKC